MLVVGVRIVAHAQRAATGTAAVAVRSGGAQDEICICDGRGSPIVHCRSCLRIHRRP